MTALVAQADPVLFTVDTRRGDTTTTIHRRVHRVDPEMQTQVNDRLTALAAELDVTPVELAEDLADWAAIRIAEMTDYATYRRVAQERGVLPL